MSCLQFCEMSGLIFRNNGSVSIFFQCPLGVFTLKMNNVYFSTFSLF